MLRITSVVGAAALPSCTPLTHSSMLYFRAYEGVLAGQSVAVCLISCAAEILPNWNQEFLDLYSVSIILPTVTDSRISPLGVCKEVQMQRIAPSSTPRGGNLLQKSSEHVRPLFSWLYTVGRAMMFWGSS